MYAFSLHLFVAFSFVRFGIPFASIFGTIDSAAHAAVLLWHGGHATFYEADKVHNVHRAVAVAVHQPWNRT